MSHLYIHIPFCAQRCGYCDFLTSTDMAQKSSYIKALGAELGLISAHYGNRLKTIYIGGGTPSMLSLSEFDYLLNMLHKNFGSAIDEFTVEMNPESTTKDKISLLKAGGVNRISLGMQALQHNVLNTLDRQSTPKQVSDAVAAIRACGIDNYSLDLIYGVPYQTKNDVLNSAREIIELGASHLSAYGLKLEHGVPMQQKVSQGQISLLDDDKYADMLDALIDYCEQRGYMRYEVSNFALLQQTSKHNMAYWYGSDTLGAGLGSVYKVGSRRYTNLRVMDKYLETVISGKLPIDSTFTEILSPQDLKHEYLMTRFRLTEGVDILDFNRRFNADFERDYHKWISQFTSFGVLKRSEHYYMLSHRGLNTANYILSRLI